MQRQNTDGSVADFTEWDSFEIGIIEGCGGGKIMAGDSLDSYFSEAYQPIYFVADSTITDTSITVGIRAESIIGASRMQTNNRQQEEKSDNKKNKRTVSKPVNKTNTQNLPQNNPAASCFGGTIERNIAGNGNVVVGNGWCKELEECDEIEFPDIYWDDHRNGYEVTNAITGQIETLNICENGFLSGIGFLGSGYIEFIEYDDLEICLNSETNKVQFKFGDDNEITINYVWDFCSDYIRNNGIIRASSIYNIPSGITPLCYDILLSLERSKYYPAPLRQGDYMFEDIWEMHEQGHRKLFEQSLIKYKPEHSAKMKNLEKKCEEFSSREEAIIFYKKEAKELIRNFYNAGLNDENQQSIRFDQSRFPIKDPTPWRELEDKVHKSVIKHIEELILSVKRGETGCRTR